MSIQLLLSFWAVSFVLVGTPGADWAYTISAGLRGRALVPAVLGLMLGHLAVTLVVAAGVGALVASTPMAMTFLTLLGATVLLWLGTSLLINPPIPTSGTEPAQSWGRWIVRGFCISGLNPKVLLLFLALLPQFTDPNGAWPIAAQIVALGTLDVLNCALIYFPVGYGAGLVLRTRPHTAMMVGRASGIVMILLSMVLVIDLSL